MSSGRAVPREELASLLFGEADDPLGALRWNLAELRRLLGLPDALRGSPVRLELPPDAFVDVRALTAGTWVEALELPGLGRELLEGVSVAGSPAFEAWLLAERRRLQAEAEGVLHEAALARLAAGQGGQAIDLAARLVSLNPFDESFQELLIRAHGASGDRAGAARQLAASVELFRRELGVEPGPAVYAAAEATGVTATVTAATGRAAAQAQLEAGEAAIGAGALDAGLECLRRAAAEAHACGDLELKARVLLALGGALVHAARGRDEEGSTALHEAIEIAGLVGLPDVAATAHRELAWVEILRCRYPRGLAQIEAAKAAAEDEPAARAFVLVGLGVVAYQTGRSGEGIELLGRALALAEEAGDLRGIAMGLAEGGVARMLREELQPATAALERSLDLARSVAWTAFVPYPEALLGIAEVLQGEPDAAVERLEHAFALGCQLRDCCWEGLAAAGLGLVEETRGNVPGALDRLEDAARRSVREPDASLFGHAFVLDLLCSFAVRHQVGRAAQWVGDLATLAARTTMREFLVRAYLHRHELGEPDALRAAGLLAADVDNPALHKRLRRPACRCRAPDADPSEHWAEIRMSFQATCPRTSSKRARPFIVWSMS